MVAINANKVEFLEEVLETIGDERWDLVVNTDGNHWYTETSNKPLAGARKLNMGDTGYWATYLDALMPEDEDGEVNDDYYRVYHNVADEDLKGKIREALELAVDSGLEEY